MIQLQLKNGAVSVLEALSIPSLAFTGVSGPTGRQGERGEKGDVGPIGGRGDIGKSAYQVWLDAGNVGSTLDFFASLNGAPGAGRLSNAVALFDTRTNFGATPGDVRYGMNSGFQAAPNNPIVQIASVGSSTAPALEAFRFNNDAKANIIQIGKSRGDGFPNSAAFHRKSLAGDRLGQINFYGSSDYGFSHAAYISVNADADNTTGNSLASLLRLQAVSVNPEGAGSGMILNSKGQTYFPAPTFNDFPHGQDWRAIVKIGPSTPTLAPLVLTPAPLMSVPVPGAIESDANGDLHRVNAAGDRRQIVTTKRLPFVDPFTVVPGAVLTKREGDDWIEIKLQMGGADWVASGPVVSLPYSQPVSPAPVTVLSVSTSDPYAQLTYYVAGKANQATIVPVYGQTLKANTTYTFTVVYRQL